MAGYTPLFSSIVTSSIWTEDDATRLLWITMLAMADQNGVVEGSIPGLANVARIKVDACAKAIRCLCQPDRYSRTTEHEGRRIHPVEGGWQIYNFAKFRRRAAHGADYYRRWREDKKEKSPDPLKKETNNPKLPQTRATVRNQRATTKGCATVALPLCPDQGNTPASNYTLQEVQDACVCLGIPEFQAQSYHDHYASQGWRKANGQPITSLRPHMTRLWDRNANCWKIDLGRDGQAPQTGKTAMQTWMERHADDPE